MNDQPLSWSVVERLRRGDNRALGEIYEAHAHAVHGVAFRLTGSAQDADDVLQDVFLALPDALRNYDGTGSFARWLRTVAARRSLMALRKKRNLREVPLAGTRRRQSARPEPVVDRLALEAALSRLPDHLRAVFVLKEVEGYRHEEIGEMLGIGAGGSMSRLHRARKTLRALLRSST